MIRSRREREKLQVSNEDGGESLWSESFDPRAVTRLNELWRIAENQHFARAGDYKKASSVATMLRAQGGWKVPDAVYAGALIPAEGEGLEFFLDIVEAFLKVYSSVEADLEKYVNVILSEHRIAYRIVENQVVSRGADELHVAVIEPTLRLLIDKRFSKAHDAYFEALKEITAGNAGDAITDAGTALQETLTAVGCTGNSLGPLIIDAVKRKFLTSHDKKIADWVSADRSSTGDAHHHSSATEADAWFALHVTGALIVRLADSGKKRGEQ